MSKRLQILMPMGGLGQRFRDEGYSKPKPLIEVDGIPMFLHALRSFDKFNGDKDYVFIVRQDAQDEYGLASSIKDILPNAKIVMMEHNTRGAAETCLLAQEYIDNDNPLIVMDCDFRFTSRDYLEKVESMVSDNTYDGVLLSFESSDPRYSYAKLGSNGLVSETAEKNPISRHALGGAYCFSRGDVFVRAVQRLLQEPLNSSMKEYYISYVYGLLLKGGAKIALASIDNLDSFGTPEELNSYNEGKASRK